MTSRSVIAIALFAGTLTGACRGTTSKEPPIVGIRNMYEQPRYDAQARSPFFGDHRTMRPLPYGVVAREMDVDPGTSEGRLPDDSGWVLEVPAEVVARAGGPLVEAGAGVNPAEAFMARGQERYGIYCAPCHGLAGDGGGVVARRALSLGGSAATMKPPTFHDDRLRSIPDGQLFATIANGIRNMPPYRHSIPNDDRWAIVAYVRALQASQVGVRTAMRDVSAATPAAAAEGPSEAPSAVVLEARSAGEHNR